MEGRDLNNNNNDLYSKIDSDQNVLHVVLYTNDFPARSAVCFKCNKIGHFSNKCHSSTIKQPSSTRSSTRYWHGCGRNTNRGRGRINDSRHNVHETEVEARDTSKPIADTTNSEVDVVKLLQAYGMVNSDRSGLRHRKVKQVDIDDISVQTSNFANDVHVIDLASKPMVLHGSALLNDVNILWESTEDIQTIHVYTASHTVQMEVGMPLNCSIDLIEVDDVQVDVVYSNVQLNGVTLKAKQDTEAQINVMSMTVFKDIQKVQRLPLFPKSCIKLVGYGNITIEYLGTTKLECIHNGTKVNAVFYVTDVMDRKVILGLQLCIKLGLIVIKCDDDCQCKNLTVAEVNATDPIRKQQEAVDQNSTPPVSLDTVIDSTNPKAHMHLFSDLFEGVGTIHDAIVHLDVRPDATRIVCSP